MLHQVLIFFQQLYLVILVISALMKKFHQRHSRLKASNAGIKAIMKG
jgi:hypothetical protein